MESRDILNKEKGLLICIKTKKFIYTKYFESFKLYVFAHFKLYSGNLLDKLP